MPLTLASIVTIIRILCIPVFITLILYYTIGREGNASRELLRWAATAVYLATFLSDALDGYLARRRREITKLGTILDPLADKALLLSSVILLAGSDAFELKLPMWFLLLVITRDAILLVGSAVIYYMVGDVVVRPRFAGKLASFCQMTAIAWVLLNWPEMPYRILLAAAGVSTSISGVQYILDGVAQLEKGTGKLKI